MSRGRDKFRKMKPFIDIMVRLFKLFPPKFRKKLLVHYRMTNGYSGLVLRYALLKTLAKNCGDNVSIHQGVYIFNPENLSVGSNVSIHPMCYIECGKKGIIIGNDVSIAHGVTLISTSHLYEGKDMPIKDQGVVHGEILIEDNVWIGAKATILYNNILKKGTVVAAGSVVTKTFEGNSVIAGVPGKIIKKRVD